MKDWIFKKGNVNENGVGMNYKVLTMSKPDIVESSLIPRFSLGDKNLEMIEKYSKDYSGNAFCRRIETQYVIAAWIQGFEKKMEDLRSAPAPITVRVVQYEPSIAMPVTYAKEYVTDIDRILGDMEKFVHLGDFGNGIETPYEIHSIDYVIVTFTDHDPYVCAKFNTMRMESHPIISKIGSEYIRRRNEVLEDAKKSILEVDASLDKFGTNIDLIQDTFFNEKLMAEARKTFVKKYPELTSWYDEYIKKMQDKYAAYAPSDMRLASDVELADDVAEMFDGSPFLTDVDYIRNYIPKAAEALILFVQKNAYDKELAKDVEDNLKKYYDETAHAVLAHAYGPDFVPNQKIVEAVTRGMAYALTNNIKL